MSSPTVSTAAIGGSSPTNSDAYRAGIDDARDDHAAGATTDVLLTRLGWMTEYLPDASDAFAAYTFGYADAVRTIRRTTHKEAVTA
jgi:hypothetical protein